MKGLLSVLFMLFLDILGFSLFIPLLPDYVKSLGGDEFAFGLVTASYAAGTFLFAPLWGHLSDRWGRRPVLLLAAGGGVIAWVGLALAPNLLWLFVARIFGGVMAAKSTVAQSWIIDVSPPELRSRNIGFTGLAFGLGFVVGPPVGGMLGSIGLPFTASISAVLVGLSFLMALFFVRESLPMPRPVRTKDSPPKAKLTGAVLGLLALGFLVNLGFNFFQTLFTPVTQKQLSWTPSSVGFALAWSGLLVGAFQGGGMGALAKRFKEETLFVFGLGLMGLALLAWGFTFAGWYLYLIIIPLTLSAALTTILIKTILAKAAPEDQIGSVLGWATSVESLTRIIAPAVGGWLLVQGAFWPGVVAGTLVLASFAASFWLVPGVRHR
jgi:DHA1 family tetracycline resistance protein-like MFS transporter